MSTALKRNGDDWHDPALSRLADLTVVRPDLTHGPVTVPMVRAAVAGTGSYLPERVLTNDEMATTIETSDAWIFERTGIHARRVAGPDESTSTMATEAGRRACDDAGIDPRDLDLVIVATLTPDYLMPATACLVQHALGAKRAGAFDLEAACSGFLFAGTVATGLIVAGLCRNVLVIGAETMSRFIDYQDRTSCILFGDGAGAAVFTGRNDGSGVLHASMTSDGAHSELLCIPAGGSRLPASADTVSRRQHLVRMAGRQIAKFATTCFVDLVNDSVAAAGVTLDDINLFVPHQVNARIIDSALKRLAIPRHKCFMNIEGYGNTSAASVPIALDEARRQGRLRPGDLALLLGFGAGLTWGATLLRM
ncbi:MAG: ketoacyl-ACP synthase III [Pirellulales bacterium]|nr:ketoacyl-ACP synthase III [Pirellulales bacterium]